MKYLICSDIHGSKKYARMFFDEVDKLNPDKVIILGDLYYNGSRNDPPEDYSSKEVVKIINPYKDKLVVCKGNCDAEVDEMVSEFTFGEIVRMKLNDKNAILTHGHHINFDHLPVEQFDIFMQGHTHISRLDFDRGVLFVNPGSISLPKDNYHSYVYLDEKEIKLIDLLTKKTIKSIKLD